MDLAELDQFGRQLRVKEPPKHCLLLLRKVDSAEGQDALNRQRSPWEVTRNPLGPSEVMCGRYTTFHAEDQPFVYKYSDPLSTVAT